jgi:hypothetical protein
MMKRLSSPTSRLIIIAIAIILVGALHKWLPWLIFKVLPVGWWFFFSHNLGFLRMLLFGLFFLLLVLLSAQLIRITLSLLVSRRGAHPFFVQLHTHGMPATLWNIIRRRSFQGARLSTLFSLWGIVIVGIVALLAASGKLDESELLFLSQNHRWEGADSLSTMRIFAFSTTDNNPVRYLRDLHTIAGDLKSSGARLVVARIPSYFYRVPESDLVILDSIKALGIVVQYDLWPEWYWSMVNYPPLSPSGQELSRNYAPEVGSSVRSAPYLAKVYRWYPCVAYGSSVPCIDVALPASARFLGYPDSLRPSCELGRVVYGPFTIPVTSDGEAISPNLDLARFDHLLVSAEHYQDHDTLQFISLLDNGKEIRYSNSFPQEYAPEVRDKIIFIAWGVFSDYGYPSLAARAYATIIESLLHNQVIRKYELFPLILAGAVVLLSALLCLKVRLTIAVTLILTGGAILYALSVWLLTTHLVLLNAAYPGVAALLSAVVFPLVRLSHENP